MSSVTTIGLTHFVIVSLKHADPVLRSYRILDGEITEEAVSLTADS